MILHYNLKISNSNRECMNCIYQTLLSLYCLRQMGNQLLNPFHRDQHLDLISFEFYIIVIVWIIIKNLWPSSCAAFWISLNPLNSIQNHQPETQKLQRIGLSSLIVFISHKVAIRLRHDLTMSGHRNQTPNPPNQSP